MSKTKKTVLIIAGAVLLSLAAPFILFAGIFAASLIGDAMITQKDVEEYGKKMQPKSGIIFRLIQHLLMVIGSNTVSFKNEMQVGDTLQKIHFNCPKRLM